MTRADIPVLVGELNPYGPDPIYALFCAPANSAGGRLQRLILGLRRPTYLGLERHNLCDVRWSAAAARARAGELLLAQRKHRAPLILLGARVARAFAFRGEPFTADTDCDGLVLIRLPHPSGRNTVWTQPGMVQRARALVAQHCPHLPLGEVDPPAGSAANAGSTS